MTTEQEVQWFAQLFKRLLDNVGLVIKGKPQQIALSWVCLLAEGHLLLEDVPGTGKTLLAKSMAKSVGGSSSRVQFTPDLLPSDVTGVMIFNQSKQEFQFYSGPVFANVVLGDEINRASPKTQSALLEVMEERQITVDGRAYFVPRPFVVIATQNPIEQAGTYALPEAQLDRFLMRTTLGYPDHDAEVDVLRGASRVAVEDLRSAVSTEQAQEMIRIAENIHVADEVLSYVVRLGRATREREELRLGMSTRGCVGLLRAAKTTAAAQAHNFVTPDDVKRVAQSVITHRLLLTPDAELDGVDPADIVVDVLESPKTRPPTVDAI